MLYKRPSLRRGGTPTGIETLEPRKKFQFGTPLFNFLEPGLQKELRAEAERKNKPTSFSKGLERGQRLKSKITGLKRFLPTGSTLQQGLGFLRGVAPTGAALKPLGLTAAIAAPVGGLMYLNRPRTQAELDFIKSQNQNLAFDYGMGPEFDDYLKERERLSKVGPKISFFDTFKTSQLDSGEEDTPKKEIDEYSDIEFLGPGSEEDKVAKILPGETALDAVLREGKVIAQKRKDDKNKNIPSKTGKTEKINIDAEDSFEADFNKMQSRLEKYFGSSKAEDKGMIAIALSDAIGTPGNIADKAAQLNKSLLKIAAGKKKDKKEIAKLAFAAAADLEAIREKRLEPSEAEKRRRRFINLKTRFDKGLLTDASEIAEFEAIRGELRMLPKSITVNEGITIGAAAGEIMDDIAEYNDEKTSKSDKEKLLTEIKGGISSLLLNEKLNKDILGNAYPQLRPFLKDGGRIGMALGGATETPAEPVDNTLNFEQLRTRLPSEITDDIVRLISTSEQALQDFAYIRTQGDVEKFNIKYGVNLVLPQNTI